MQKTFKTLMMGLTASSLLASGLVIAADELNGETLYTQKLCQTCHGQGASKPLTPAYPNLAGQNEKYAAQQMKDIKSGARNNGLSMAMKGLTMAVSDEEFDAIAKWIGSLDSFSAGKTVDMEADAAQLFKDKGCNTCHGDDANSPVESEENGNPPIIVGQNKMYLLTQMKDIRDGKRANSNSSKMKAKVEGVTDEEFSKLADWLAK
jgi:cytochrome c